MPAKWCRLSGHALSPGINITLQTLLCSPNIRNPVYLRWHFDMFKRSKPCLTSQAPQYSSHQGRMESDSYTRAFSVMFPSSRTRVVPRQTWATSIAWSHGESFSMWSVRATSLEILGGVDSKRWTGSAKRMHCNGTAVC